jgi:hypothetical protein
MSNVRNAQALDTSGDAESPRPPPIDAVEDTSCPREVLEKIKKPNFCSEIGCPGMRSFRGQVMWSLCEARLDGRLLHADEMPNEGQTLCDHFAQFTSHSTCPFSDVQELIQSQCGLCGLPADPSLAPGTDDSDPSLLSPTDDNPPVDDVADTVHICGLLNDEAKCYEVPRSVADSLPPSELGSTYFDTADACLAQICTKENAWPLAQDGGSQPKPNPLTQDGGRRRKTDAADGDCYMEGTTYICVSPPEKSLAPTGSMPVLAPSPAPLTQAPQMRPELSIEKAGSRLCPEPDRASLATSLEQHRKTFQAKARLAGQRSKQASTLKAQIRSLEQKQRYELLGEEVARQSLSVATNNNDFISQGQAVSWASPFSGGARLLGSGSAVIAQKPGASERLLSVSSLNGAQRIALAQRNAPVLGALDNLQTGTPLGYVNTSSPMNAWAVGGLDAAYPQSSLPRVEGSPTTLKEALQVLSQSPKGASSDEAKQRHWCCHNATGDCVDRNVAEGTEGCTPIMLGALNSSEALAQCKRSCPSAAYKAQFASEGGMSIQPSNCFMAHNCEPRVNASWRAEPTSAGPCFNDQEVCMVALRQRQALKGVGSQYA